METRIRLKNIQLYGWHGVSEKERKTGQQFEIDIEVMYALNDSIKSDDFDSSISLIVIRRK